MVVVLLLSFVVTAMRKTEIKAATTNAMARIGTMRARFDISEEERSCGIGKSWVVEVQITCGITPSIGDNDDAKGRSC